MARPLSSHPRRIGVIATDPLRVLGLMSIFESHPGVEVVPISGQAALVASGISILLLDASGTEPTLDLLAALRRVKPRTKIIVIGAQQDHGYIEQIIGAGAKGYLSLQSTPEEIRMAFDIVLDGSIWAPRKVLARLIEDRRIREPRRSSGVSAFTAREVEVLRLLVSGRSNRDIASVLKIDESTVKAHVGRLMRKVGVENRTALTVQVMERKLLEQIE